MFFTEQFDVVVVGAGHAGCEVEAFAGVSEAEARSRNPERSLRGT
jgi:tRNA U34 5-carboxymethylaminomethyl modifying enzyme MnmG/GidA